VFVVGDGLSAFAVERRVLPLMTQVAPRLAATGIAVCPTVFLAGQARVALADEVGEALGARLAVMLIGERPGLSSPDSLGVYLTFAPRRGRQNAERNCISNIRPAGLTYEPAAIKLTWLAREALRLGLTGVDLKDRSELRLGPSAAVAPALSG
jgi:ethanolamine ammonia-lyase small subunit